MIFDKLLANATAADLSQAATTAAKFIEENARLASAADLEQARKILAQNTTGDVEPESAIGTATASEEVPAASVDRENPTEPVTAAPDRTHTSSSNVEDAHVAAELIIRLEDRLSENVQRAAGALASYLESLSQLIEAVRELPNQYFDVDDVAAALGAAAVADAGFDAAVERKTRADQELLDLISKREPDDLADGHASTETTDPSNVDDEVRSRREFVQRRQEALRRRASAFKARVDPDQ